jgi:membrane protease YdiL (CAAX protease family)
LEEGYWRGLLLDNTRHWPAWLGVLYSTVFFAMNHPLTVGVYSIANRHPAVLISTGIMGLAWAVVYRKTHSLRWTMFAHMLADLLNLSILAFLNIVVPPGFH